MLSRLKIARTPIKIIISGLLIFFLLYTTDLSAFWHRVSQLSPSFILFAWFYYALCQWISAYRWQLFLTAKNIHVPLLKLFHFYMVGMFLNNFVPGSIGGDIFKTFDLYRFTRQGKISVISVILERFTGLIGLGIISIVALAISINQFDSPTIPGLVAVSAIIIFGIALIIWYEPIARPIIRILETTLPNRVSDQLRQFYNALYSYKIHVRVIFIAIILSTLIQVLFALLYSMTSMALGVPIELYYFIIFLPIVTLATMIPISIGGLGIREAILVLLFAEVGVASSDILSISLTVHILNTTLSLWGGAILLLRKPISAGVDSQHSGRE